MPQKSWAVGEEVLAADFQTYVQNQVVPQFTGTAQRDSQWAAPPIGALCVTTDTNTLWQRVGTVWQAAGGFPGPRGVLFTIRNPADVNVGVAWVTVHTYTFTSPSNRRVKASWSFQMEKPAGEPNAIATPVLQMDTDSISRNMNISTSQVAQSNLVGVWNAATGSHTIQANMYNTAGNVLVKATGQFLVEDIGIY